jgi:hypothetical protein
MRITSKVALALGLLAGGVLVLASPPARAQPVEPLPIAPPPLVPPAASPPVLTAGTEPTPAPPPPPPQTRGFDRARVAAGYRANFVSDPAIDSYSSSGLMSQLSLDASYAVLAVGRVAIAAGVAWDFGSLAGNFNDSEVFLQVNRFTAPIELRFAITPWLYGFGRAAPGAAHYHATLENNAAPLAGGPWVAAADFSGGVSLLVAPHSADRPNVARVWITPEVGYGLAGDRTINLEARNQPIVDAEAPRTLGALSVQGVFFRAAIGLTL